MGLGARGFAARGRGGDTGNGWDRELECGKARKGLSPQRSGKLYHAEFDGAGGSLKVTVNRSARKIGVRTKCGSGLVTYIKRETYGGLSKDSPLHPALEKVAIAILSGGYAALPTSSFGGLAAGSL
jgi:hypothetical protein